MSRAEFSIQPACLFLFGGKGVLELSLRSVSLAAENNGEEGVRESFFFFGLRMPSLFFESVHLLLVESVLVSFIFLFSF